MLYRISCDNIVNAMNKKDQVMKTNRMPTEVLETKKLCAGGKHRATSGITSFKSEKLNEVIIVHVCSSVFNRKVTEVGTCYQKAKS